MPNAGGRLAGKTAIITGAGSSGPGMGNGKATAILFAREGARVLLADLHEDRARETLTTIEAEGGVASTIEIDVTVEEDASRLAETAIERYGRIDVLVNNVGISKRGSVLDVTPEEWDRVMMVNVKEHDVVQPSRRATDEGGWRWIDNQYCFHRGPQGSPQHPLYHIQGSSYRADILNGRRPRPGQHTCQRYSAGPGLHADGRAPDGRGDAGRGGWRRRLSGRRGRDGMWGGRRCSWQATRLGGSRELPYPWTRV